MKALGQTEEGKTDNKTTASKAVKISALLFVIFMAFSFCSGICTGMSQYFPSLSESYGLGTSLGALMMSACMIANTCGKLLCGTLIEKLGTRLTLSCYAILVLSGVFPCPYHA